jgi:hypothetical protein
MIWVAHATGGTLAKSILGLCTSPFTPRGILTTNYDELIERAFSPLLPIRIEQGIPWFDVSPRKDRWLIDLSSRTGRIQNFLHRQTKRAEQQAEPGSFLRSSGRRVAALHEALTSALQVTLRRLVEDGERQFALCRKICQLACYRRVAARPPCLCKRHRRLINQHDFAHDHTLIRRNSILNFLTNIVSSLASEIHSDSFPMELSR